MSKRSLDVMSSSSDDPVTNESKKPSSSAPSSSSSNSSSNSSSSSSSSSSSIRKPETMSPEEKAELQRFWDEIKLFLVETSFLIPKPAPHTFNGMIYKTTYGNSLELFLGNLRKLELLDFVPSTSWPSLKYTQTCVLVALINDLKNGDYCHDNLIKFLGYNETLTKLLYSRVQYLEILKAANTIATFIADLITFYQIKTVMEKTVPGFLDTTFDIELLCGILHIDGEGIIRSDLLPPDGSI